MVHEAAEVVALQGRGHRVDREVPAVEVLADRRLLHRRQGSRAVVELGPRGRHVDAAALVDDDRSPEAVVGTTRPPRAPASASPERDAVALDGDVNVEARLVHEHVANGSADEVHALEGLAYGLNRLEHGTQMPEARQSSLGDALRRGRRLLRRAALRARAERRSCVTTPTTSPSAEDGDAADVRARRRAASPRRAACSSAHVTTSELMTLFTGACESPWPIAWSRSSRVTCRRGSSPHRRGCRSGDGAGRATIAWATESSGPDEAGRARHDLGRREPVVGPPAEASQNGTRASASDPLNRRRRLGVAAAAERVRDHGRVEFRARACERRRRRGRPSRRGTRARASVRSTILWARFETPSTYSGHGTRRDEHLDSAASCGSSRRRPARRAARARSSASGVCRYCATIVLAGAPWRRHHASASASRMVVLRVAERAGVLVDAEREDCRLERRDVDLPLGQDRHHRRRERAVLREDEVLRLHPVGRLAGVVVEDDDLDLGVARDLLELAQALRCDGLDHDQPPDRRGVDAAGLGELELVGVQPVELPHVPVQRAGQRDRRARVQPPGGEHGPERVEVRVRVGDDDVHGTKVSPALHQPPLWGT